MSNDAKFHHMSLNNSTVRRMDEMMEDRESEFEDVADLESEIAMDIREAFERGELC